MPYKIVNSRNHSSFATGHSLGRTTSIAIAIYVYSYHGDKEDLQWYIAIYIASYLLCSYSYIHHIEMQLIRNIKSYFGCYKHTLHWYTGIINIRPYITWFSWVINLLLHPSLFTYCPSPSALRNITGWLQLLILTISYRCFLGSLLMWWLITFINKTQLFIV